MVGVEKGILKAGNLKALIFGREFEEVVADEVNKAGAKQYALIYELLF